MNIITYLNRIYRLSLGINKHEVIVWKDLKKLHADAKWSSGVYENERYIESVFEIDKEIPETYFYMINDRHFYCKVKMFENFPTELTSDIFILATHFNNLLINGVVIINVDNLYVEYQTKCELLIPLLYKGEIHDQLIRHYNTSKDIYWAFKKLINENEAPAIIISDLLKTKDKKPKNEKEEYS